jgi:hypothetical protein
MYITMHGQESIKYGPIFNVGYGNVTTTKADKLLWETQLSGGKGIYQEDLRTCTETLLPNFVYSGGKEVFIRTRCSLRA